jgi:lysophospholipase L1-like esterase
MSQWGSDASGSATKAIFNPSQISGLQLWLDATDALFKSGNTLEATSGNIVTLWPDKSGNNRAAAASNGSPTVSLINGKKAIQFNGNSQLSTPAFIDSAYNAAGMTMFVVAKANVTQLSNQVLAGINTPNFWVEVNGSNGLTTNTISTVTGLGQNANRGGIDGVYVSGWSGTTGNEGYFGVNKAIAASPTGTNMVGSDAGIRRTTSGSIGLTTARAVSVGSPGGFSYFDGLIGEVVLFNRLLTDAELALMQDYLMVKWCFDLPTVVCIGDSITSGTGSTGTATQSQVTGTTNYPNRLKALIGGESIACVRTDAIPGRRIVADMKPIASASRLYNILHSKSSTKRQTVVVLFGTNDINSGATGSGVYDHIADTCLDAYATGYRVVVCTILPRQDTSFSTTFETSRLAANAKLRLNYTKFAHALVDLDLTVLTNPLDGVYFAADKVHLLDAGNQKLAEAIYPLI